MTWHIIEKVNKTGENDGNQMSDFLIGTKKIMNSKK